MTKREANMFLLLREIPIWELTVGLVFLCIGAVHLLREFKEGMMYNVAFSSEYGDLILIACITIGVTSLQRAGHIPTWHTILGNLRFDGVLWEVTCIACGIMAAVVWIVLVLSWDHHLGAPSDIYHNSIVVGLLAALVLATVPAVFLAPHYATGAEKGITVLLLALYAMLVIIDKQTGRSEQLRWLQRHKPWEVLDTFASRLFAEQKSVQAGRNLPKRPWEK